MGAQPGSFQVFELQGTEETSRQGCDDQGQSDRPRDPVEGKGRIAIVMGVRAVTPPGRRTRAGYAPVSGISFPVSLEHKCAPVNVERKRD